MLGLLSGKAYLGSFDRTTLCELVWEREREERHTGNYTTQKIAQFHRYFETQMIQFSMKYELENIVISAMTAYVAFKVCRSSETLK